MSNNPKGGPACGNPYTILGLKIGATDAEISKAYKRLALVYHPDKQQQKAEDEEILKKKFHDLTEARSFLLDPEFSDKRKKYDLALKSYEIRREQDEKREMEMSGKRKKWKEELLNKEKRARLSKEKGGAAKEPVPEDLLSRLRKEGKRMREELGTKQERERVIQERTERILLKQKLEARQIRLKWSRKRIGKSHSEDTIASIMKKFGAVENVELIGDKGNAALVTFADKKSCALCVDEYRDSEEMRASYVGGGPSSTTKPPSAVQPNQRDVETLEERRMRQAAERESLLRKMEMEDEMNNDDAVKTKAGVGVSNMDDDGDWASSKSFPPHIPIDKEDIGLNFFQRLEKLEKIVLPQCVKQT